MTLPRKLRHNKQKQTSTKQFFPKWYIAGLGGIWDCFGTLLQNLSLFLVPPSVFAIGKNATVISTAILDKYYLKNSLSSSKMFAVVLIVFGFVLVSLSTVFGSSSDNSPSLSMYSLLGVVFLFVSLFFQGFTFCYQEQILKTYSVPIRQMIGFESMMGVMFCTLMFGALIKVSCFSETFCVKIEGAPLDSPAYAVRDLFLDGAWKVYVLLWFSIMVFNTVGLEITKHSGAVFRVVLDTLRTVVIWLISIVCGFERVDHIGTLCLELCGFVLLISGNLVFNGIVKLRYFESKSKVNLENKSASIELK